MEAAKLKKLIEGIDSEGLLQCLNFGRSGEGCAWIDSSSLQRICAALKNDRGVSWLENLSAMQMDDVIVFTYFLRARESGDTLLVRSSVSLPEGEKLARFPSVRAVWPAAVPFEEEIGELFGVQFGHGTPRKLLPEGFKGFPLRKSFQIQPSIHTPEAEGLT